MTKYKEGQFGEPIRGDEVDDFLRSADGKELAEVADPDTSARIEACYNAMSGRDPEKLAELERASIAMLELYRHGYMESDQAAKIANQLESAARAFGTIKETP